MRIVRSGRLLSPRDANVVRLLGGRPTEPAATLGAKQAQAALQVERGGKTGPRLARTRAALGKVRALATALASGRRAINEDPTHSDASRNAAHSALRQRGDDELEQVLATAGDDLDGIEAAYPAEPPLGSRLVIPNDRVGDLPTIANLAERGTAQQFQSLAEQAVADDDLHLGSVLAFVARSNLAAGRWSGADRAPIEDALAHLAEHFTTVPGLMASYAAAVADLLRSGLTTAARLLDQPDAFSAYDAAAAFRHFADPGDAGSPVDWGEQFRRVVRDGGVAAADVLHLQRDGSLAVPRPVE